MAKTPNWGKIDLFLQREITEQIFETGNYALRKVKVQIEQKIERENVW